MARPPERDKDGLVTTRTALVILLAVLTAGGAAALLVIAGKEPAEAAFIAAGVLAVALKFYNELIIK
jgi:hypothetical protein